MDLSSAKVGDKLICMLTEAYDQMTPRSLPYILPSSEAVVCSVTDKNIIVQYTGWNQKVIVDKATGKEVDSRGRFENWVSGDTWIPITGQLAIDLFAKEKARQRHLDLAAKHRKAAELI